MKQRSLSEYPFWLNYARLGGTQLQTYLAIFNTVKPGYDGNLQRSGYCAVAQIVAMTGISAKTVGNASRALREKGLLRAVESPTHVDKRLIWTVPYFEPTAEQLEDLSQAGWYEVTTEAARYNQLVVESFKPTFTVPCAAKDLEAVGLPVLASWAGVSRWRSITNMVAKIATAAKCDMKAEEALYRGLLLRCNVEAAVRSPASFLIEMSKAIVHQSIGQKLSPTAARYKAAVKECAEISVDIKLAYSASGKVKALRLVDLLQYSGTPEPLPECVRIPRIPAVEHVEVPGEELDFGDEDFEDYTLSDFDDLIELGD